MSKQPPAKFLILQHMALKQGGRCVYCGVAMLTEWRECHADWGWKSPFRMTWDHIIPKARGGSNDPSNAAAACRQCNTRKADMPAEKYILTMMPNPINQRHETIPISNPRAGQQHSRVASGEIQFARASEEDRNDRGY